MDKDGWSVGSEGRRKDREEMKIEDDICQLVAMQIARREEERLEKEGQGKVEAWITEYY